MAKNIKSDKKDDDYNNCFILNSNLSCVDNNEYLYNLVNCGEGTLWNYQCEKMFSIEKIDIRFNEDFCLKTPQPDFISMRYYYSVSGEELKPYRQIFPNVLVCFLGDPSKVYRAVFHKNIPVKCIGINIKPDFYNNFLKSKLKGQYIDPKIMVKEIMTHADLSKFATILKQMNNYQNHGTSANLFYEAKILEIISLMIDEYQNNLQKHSLNISDNDIETLKSIASYIDHHYNFSISNQHLAKLALMSETKLKSIFKAYFGITITEFIIRKRIEQAEHLLINTDLSIAEIAKVVGYNRSDNFSKQFVKITGLLPHNYRKITKTD